MSPKNGDRAFPISAYAITSDDAKKFGTTGIPGDTDYHIFQRYVIPGAMGFLQAFGYAAEKHAVPAEAVKAYGLQSITNLIVRRPYGSGGKTIALKTLGD